MSLNLSPELRMRKKELSEIGEEIQYYLAPMEEITTFLYRNTLTEFFGAPDRCFAPFISPSEKKLIKKRERRDIAPENNSTVHLVPQILTNNSRAFCDVIEVLNDMGYREVNLNLGCPSGTVTAKGKGSGFLQTPEKLNRFLVEIFSFVDSRYNGDFLISVKTRIGFSDEKEWPLILEILSGFPFREIIIHPRLRSDFYNGRCHMNAMDHAVSCNSHCIVYNGDLFTGEDIIDLYTRYPQINTVMLGRGVVRNPGLIREMRTGERMKKEELFNFQHVLYQRYCDLYQDEYNAMHKLKELWTYMGTCFEESERPLRTLLKARYPDKYLMGVEALFSLPFDT